MAKTAQPGARGRGEGAWRGRRRQSRGGAGAWGRGGAGRGGAVLGGTSPSSASQSMRSALLSGCASCLRGRGTVLSDDTRWALGPNPLVNHPRSWQLRRLGEAPLDPAPPRPTSMMQQASSRLPAPPHYLPESRSWAIRVRQCSTRSFPPSIFPDHLLLQNLPTKGWGHLWPLFQPGRASDRLNG